ncbi:MAG: GAF domain-containing protein [Blastocatellia bacterium]
MKKSEIPVLLIHAGLSQCEKVVDFLRDYCFYRVDTATDAEKALDLAASHVDSHHLALVDFGLTAGGGERPGRIAIDLIRKIKAESPDTEIIAFLAADPAGVDEALHAGVFRCLAEPINFSELATVMRQALEHRELKMQAQENQALEQLMQASAGLLAGQSEEAVLDCSLKAIGILAFDRARLYLLSDDKEFLVCKAQSGMPDNYVGQKWPVADSKSLQILLREQRAIVFKYAGGDPWPPGDLLNDDGGGECGLVPLLSRGELIGQLSVDNKVSRRPILERNLRTLSTFASHTAAAIENARLLAGVERRAHNLSAVLKALSSIGSSLDLGEAMKSACRAAVELLGVDHSGLVLFAPDLKTGPVSAEHPENLGARNLEIPLWRVPTEEQLIHSREPVIISDVAGDASLGPVRDILVGLGVCSILIVPIVIKGDVVGSFSLDSLDRKRVFANEDVELCKVFASHVAVAINNAQLFRRARREVRKLTALRQTTLAINSTLSRTTLLRNIIRSAVRLLGAKSGGLYQYFPEHRKLVVIADYNRPGHLNKALGLGEGMAGKLIERGELSMIIPDYAKWEGRTHIYDDTQPFGAVVSVPLKWKKQVTGVLYVDDAVGREFDDDDARLLGLFADQAALALSNAQLIAKDEEKLRRLEKLSQATTGVMRATTLDDRLKLIVRHTAEILEADVCGAYLFKEDGRTRFEAFYGPDERLGGPSGPIPGGPQDAAAAGGAAEGFIVSNEGRSVLAVDLKHKKEGEEERLVGRLYVSNKKSEKDGGMPSAGFSREDEWILNILADAAVVAIENAELVQEVSKRNAHLELLLGVSNALSQAGDLAGGLQYLAEMLASVLSHSFCRILLIGEDASSLKMTAAYYSPQQCRGVPSGTGDQETVMMSEWPCLYELLRKGEPEVLRHAGQASGQSLIRFSERLGLGAPIQSLLIVPLKIEGRLVGMFDLGDVIDKGVNPFADEEIEMVKAIAAQATALIDRMRRNAERENLHKAAQAMSRFFELGDVLRPVVSSVKDALGADSVAVLPYDEGIDMFIPAGVTLLSIIANQASIAIRTAEQCEAIKRRSAYLDALCRAGKAITASFGSGRKQVLGRIVEQAVECLKVGKGLAVAFGTIQLYNDETDELHFESAFSPEYTEVFARLGEVRFVKGVGKGHRRGIAGRAVLTREPQLVGDVTKDQDYVEFDPRMKSALCVPLLDQGKVLGVLGMESDQENGFDMADLSTLEGLAELAVIAIRNAQQYDDLKNTRVLAESRAALAWMGMTSSTWRHMIHGHAITIKDLVELALSDLDKSSLKEVREKLSDISDLAMLIQQHPITAPLSSEEGVRSILVNALLRERMGQLWEHEAYKSVELRFDFRLPGAATVRANPDWLNRALGVLVDNAIDAMKASGERVLSVSSRAAGRVAQIEIKDTGDGIPSHILGRVLQKPIEHPKGTKKLGLGLLMARLIVQVYGGELRCKETGPAGTTMVLSLPLEA